MTAVTENSLEGRKSPLQRGVTHEFLASTQGRVLASPYGEIPLIGIEGKYSAIVRKAAVEGSRQGKQTEETEGPKKRRSFGTRVRKRPRQQAPSIRNRDAPGARGLHLLPRDGRGCLLWRSWPRDKTGGSESSRRTQN